MKDMHKYAPALLATALLTGLPRPCEAARLSFSRRVTLDADGIELRILRGAHAQPLAPSRVHHYRSADGGLQERFAPRDLWYASQYRGRWSDGRGNAMVLGRVARTLPTAFSREHVLPAEYASAAGQQAVPDRLPPQRVPQCVADFAQASLEGAPLAVRDTMRTQNAHRFAFKGQSPSRLGYVFSLRAGARAARRPAPFFVLFEVSDDVDLSELAKTVEQDFLTSVRAVAVRTQRDADTADPLRSTALPADATPSADMESSRRAVMDSLKGLDDWWAIDTPHYVLASDLSRGRRTFVHMLQEHVETLRAACEQMIPARRPIQAVGVVRVFAESEAYETYVDPAMRWTTGLWDPARRQLLIRSPDTSRRRDRREAILGTIYHEAFHQYLFYALSGVTASAWFNEGHASLFEGAEVKRTRIEIGEVEPRARAMSRLAGDGFDLDRLLGLSYADFYGRPDDEKTRSVNYALAWGLVYYLRKGAPAEEEGALAALPTRYLDALWQTRDPRRATQAAFDGIDREALGASLADFWKSRSRRRAARRHRVFPPGAGNAGAY